MVLVVVGLVLANACTFGTDAPATPLESAGLGGWVAEPLDWGPCEDVAGVECATLEVPLDWDAPQGTTTDLVLGRTRATGDRVGALLTNPGGPGGSGLQFLFAEPFGPDITSRFDIVSWDPRGVGASSSLNCDAHVDEFLANDPSPDDPTEQSALDDDAERIADDCANSSGGLVANIGTDDVARDVEAIRTALGERSISFMGFSYGTLIGLRYLDLFPDTTRALVLDGVVDPTQNLSEWLADQTVAIDASIRRALDACDDEPACPLDDPQADFDELQRRVESAPIRSGDDDASGGDDKADRLGPARFETGAVFASYEPAVWPDLWAAIADGLDGDGTAMSDLASQYYDLGGYTAYAAVECIDSEHPTGPEEYRAFADNLRALSPRIGGSVANELLPCAFWPTPPTSIIGEVNGDGGPPVLVLGNRGDAATPYENSTKVASMLSDGHLVSYDGEGHTGYGRSACVDDAVLAYLVDLEVPPSDPNCGR